MTPGELDWPSIWSDRAGRGPDATPIGLVPSVEALDLSGVDVTPEQMRALLTVDGDEWREEIPLIREFFDEFGDKLPAELRDALNGLAARFEGSS